MTMINCPKCQVPNPDSATACAACGTTLVGQQFAQALDQAMRPGAPPAPSDAPPLPPPPSAPAPFPQGLGGESGPMIADPGMDPIAAQAEINRFMAEQRARKRTKSIIYLLILGAIAGVIAFFVISGAQKKARTEAVVQFYQSFNKLDDDSVGTFFKCVVRAQHMDIHKASDTLVLTDGLEKAFSNYPKGQPEWLRNKCIPMLGGALEDLGKLKAPDGFGEAIEAMKSALKEVQTVFERYAATIDRRKNEAADEQEVRAMNADFHNAVENKDSPKALPYVNFLICAVPDLVKQAKALPKPPDTQPVVDHIFKGCVDPKIDQKTAVAYADKLRKQCFPQRNDNQKKTGDYNVLVNKMAGDARDLEALNACFRRSNRGFAREEIEAVAKVFIKYNDARGKVRAEVGKVKEELTK
jgi:hypothetical protein